MARDELVGEYREGRLARPVFLRRLRRAGVSVTAALALAAAFAPAGQAESVPSGPDGPGNSEAAADQNCAQAVELAERWGADGSAFVPLVWAASRKTGTGCTAGGSSALPGGEEVDPPLRGVEAQHNEILVRA